jgi:hypothetical protein
MALVGAASGRALAVGSRPRVGRDVNVTVREPRRGESLLRTRALGRGEGSQAAGPGLASGSALQRCTVAQAMGGIWYERVAGGCKVATAKRAEPWKQRATVKSIR